jgi:hypothetical protein
MAHEAGFTLANTSTVPVGHTESYTGMRGPTKVLSK